MSDSFSVRLPEEHVRFLDRMAKATDRSRNNIISSAVAKMKENYEYIEKLVEEGDADIAAGRVFSHDEVMQQSQDIIAQAKKRVPA